MPSPARIVDAHHHFLDPSHAQPFLGTLGAPAYTPEQYAADAEALPIEKTVHVEALADGDDVETKWVEGLVAAGKCKVAAIVAACDLAAPDASAKLDLIKAASPRVRGIRWIVDYEGAFDGGKTNGALPTHLAPSSPPRSDGNLYALPDYLRDTSGPAAEFERGFGLLAAKDLSFDLQCVPAQLQAAAALIGRHPQLTVILDHLGKLRHLRADAAADAEQLGVWRAGMRALAALPNVYVKLSMLGYAVPGWYAEPTKQEYLKALVLEVIDLFGPARCMFASNWHINAPVSDSDGASEIGPTMTQLYTECFASWVAHLSSEEQNDLFAGTAERVYRI